VRWAAHEDSSRCLDIRRRRGATRERLRYNCLRFLLDLPQMVLAEDSTFYGDLFPHVIRWNGDLYLEDGLHRALRAACRRRQSISVVFRNNCAR